MNKEAELSQALYDLVKRITRSCVVIEGVIISVDETKFTCDVSVKNGDNPDGDTHFDVPLKVLVSNQASIVEIPEVNSTCIICFRDSNMGRPQILMIDKALKILVNCDNIVFNDGTLGGLVIVGKNVDRLNKIEKDLNDLKAVFSGWTPVSGDGGAALKTAASTWMGQQIQLTTDQDLENPKIKQ